MRRTPKSGPSPMGRGQTVQDFLLGIAVFLLAIGAAFSALPTFDTTQPSATDDATVSQCDRLSTAILEEFETGATPNELDGTALGTVDESTLEARLGTRSTDEMAIDSVEFVVESIDGGERIVGYGDEPEGRTTVERIVTLEGEDCVNGCRLVVRCG